MFTFDHNFDPNPFRIFYDDFFKEVEQIRKDWGLGEKSNTLSMTYNDSNRTFRLEGPVPGCTKDDVKVTFTYPEVSVTAERKDADGNVLQTYTHRYRNTSLPKKQSKFDAATVRNGWLVIELTSDTASTPYEIPVEQG